MGGQRKRVSHLRELLLEKCLLRREGVSLYPLICNCFNQGSQTLSSPTRQKPTRCGDTALAIRPCTLARGHCSQPLFAVRSAARRTHSHRDASSPASFFTQAHHTPVLTKLSEPLAGYPNQACFAPSDCPAPWPPSTCALAAAPRSPRRRRRASASCGWTTTTLRPRATSTPPSPTRTMCSTARSRA